MSLSDYYWDKLNATGKAIYEELEQIESDRNYDGWSLPYNKQLEIYDKFNKY